MGAEREFMVLDLARLGMIVSSSRTRMNSGDKGTMFIFATIYVLAASAGGGHDVDGRL